MKHCAKELDSFCHTHITQLEFAEGELVSLILKVSIFWFL